MLILEDFKKHTGLALIFLCVGFLAGLGVHKYLGADLVMHDFYIYKSDIGKTHVPIDRFAEVSKEMKATKSENESLKKQNAQLLASQNSMSVSVCQRYANEANAIMTEQQRTENSIQSALSPYVLSVQKDEPLLQADARRAQELRKYSELLNLQLIQIREEIAKCGK